MSVMKTRTTIQAAPLKYARQEIWQRKSHEPDTFLVALSHWGNEQCPTGDVRA